MAVEVDAKNRQKSEKVHFLKCTFWPQKYFGPKIILAHVKIKSKISYLGKKISFLPKKITEQKAVEVNAKNRQNPKKVHFLKCTFWPQKYFGPTFFLAHMKIKSKISYLGKKNCFLPKKITEQKAVKVDAKNRQKSEKVHFLKCTFWVQKYFGPKKNLAHVKIKSKISYLGKRISILHRQMTELWSFEVTVKNVMNTAGAAQNFYFICLG